MIRTLRRQGEMESYQSTNQACALYPSTTGVLTRLERDDTVRHWEAPGGQRRVCVGLTRKGQQCFVSVSGDMEESYRRIQGRFGKEELAQLLELLNELKKVRP